MIAVHGRVSGILIASLLAGPLFVFGIWLGEAASQWPRPITMDGAPPALVLLVPLSMTVGFLLGALPITIGSFAMSRLGARYPVMRSPLAWLAVGTAIGGGIAAYLMIDDADLSGPIAFVLSCGGCALFARWRVRWGVRQPPRSTLTPAVAISACPAK